MQIETLLLSLSLYLWSSQTENKRLYRFNILDPKVRILFIKTATNFSDFLATIHTLHSCAVNPVGLVKVINTPRENTQRDDRMAGWNQYASGKEVVCCLFLNSSFSYLFFLQINCIKKMLPLWCTQQRCCIIKQPRNESQPSCTSSPRYRHSNEIADKIFCSALVLSPCQPIIHHLLLDLSSHIGPQADFSCVQLSCWMKLVMG